MNPITDQEKERYNRQMLLPGWEEISQKNLKESVVFIAGAGGLGSPVSIYLACAGTGCLRICDSGNMELSNLNRQILHDDRDLEKNKAESAKVTINRMTPHVDVKALSERITNENIRSLVGNARLMIDCLDNFDTRFILNDYAVKTGLPLIHGGVTGLSGQVSFIKPPETPCLACFVHEPPSSSVFPILGATAGVVGCIQALEALKYLTGTGSLLKKRILFWDGEYMRFYTVSQSKDPDCKVCGKP